jgi:Uma2 family endonuclease
MATTTTALLTAEEAAVHAPEGRWELVRGEVVTYVPVQPEHAECVQAISTAVENFLGGRERALMGPEVGFIVGHEPEETVRAPDWSLTWRAEAEARRKGAWIDGGPNLAVEVVSPDDAWVEVQEKIDEYLSARAQLVWVINPQARTVHVIRPDTPTVVLRVSDTLTGDPVLPGFTLSLATLFAPVVR